MLSEVTVAAAGWLSFRNKSEKWNESGTRLPPLLDLFPVYFDYILVVDPHRTRCILRKYCHSSLTTGSHRYHTQPLTQPRWYSLASSFTKSVLPSFRAHCFFRDTTQLFHVAMDGRRLSGTVQLSSFWPLVAHSSAARRLPSFELIEDLSFVEPKQCLLPTLFRRPCPKHAKSGAYQRKI